MFPIFTLGTAYKPICVFSESRGSNLKQTQFFRLYQFILANCTPVQFFKYDVAVILCFIRILISG